MVANKSPPASSPLPRGINDTSVFLEFYKYVKDYNAQTLTITHTSEPTQQTKEKNPVLQNVCARDEGKTEALKMCERGERYDKKYTR